MAEGPMDGRVVEPDSGIDGCRVVSPCPWSDVAVVTALRRRSILGALTLTVMVGVPTLAEARGPGGGGGGRGGAAPSVSGGTGGSGGFQGGANGRSGPGARGGAAVRSGPRAPANPGAEGQAASQGRSKSHGHHGHHEHHGHRGHHKHGGALIIGSSFGFGPWWWGPAWWTDPWWTPAYGYGSWPYVEAEAPTVYVERPRSYWYYCLSLQGYYPAVQSCPETWVPVPAGAD